MPSIPAVRGLHGRRLPLARAIVVSIPIALAAAACTNQNGGDKPSAILEDATVVAALRDMSSRTDPAPGQPSFAADCINLASEFLQSSMAPFMDAEVASGAKDAPDLTGTWAWATTGPAACGATDSATFPQFSDCSGSITWTDQGGGHITQTNVGGVSQGSGNVAFIGSDTHGGALIVQENDASGAGCEQHVANLLHVSSASNGWSITGIDVIVSSSCPAPTWKCFGSAMSQ